MAAQNSTTVAITGGTITGITDLTVADGGTGASTITANSVILGNGTSALSGNLVAPSTSGNILTSNGTTWTSAAAPTGITATTGSAPYYGARSWVNFNGTGAVAIRASGNVSSITDNGTGDYTINFTTAMPDANYAATFSTTGESIGNTTGALVVVAGSPAGGANLKSTTQLRIQSGSADSVVLLDMAELNVVIHR
jgi:hypothetical protein